MDKPNVNNNGSPELNSASGIQTQQTAISLNTELDLTDYLTSVPISQKTADELVKQIAKSTNQREDTRSKLAMFLAKVFGCTLGASYLLMALTAFNPNVDKAAIKDLISQTTTPQVTLLSFALGFYFASNKDKD
ncbi:hypothetical protein GNF10_34210 [Nostoc sp. UCD121]|uniref:hypothetical protein n=1 Tax=unclassified Nostoc TaxID=2593658 RepID=UPI00162558FD|nr:MULTISPECIES: hypothetical protein [unclassified Nostoc]MBC1225262.1 hypothetical protein [Nostoc sp. UCD120]MBC1280856.1 hypothetical protein [Nostoc sp. UCD121]